MPTSSARSGSRSRPAPRSTTGRGRQRSALRQLGWAFAVSCVAVAIWQSLPHGLRPLYDNLLHRSNHIGTVIRHETTRHGLTPSTTPTSTPAPHRRPR